MSIEHLRNIAIVAHVDHGKTTLVDCLLKQSGTFSERTVLAERVMDSNDQEKERGITILSKNTAITWQGNRINIVDTPGHADFGGEVERVLSMVDSVLILVDAMDGPMPQTRFVTQKAFAMGFKPIVVVNKIDRPGARPDWVIDQVFDLFDKLGATNEQLDFPIVYASALHGYASLDDDARDGDMTPLYEAIMKHVSPPDVDPDGPFQMRISQLDYNNFVGLIGVGRIQRGKVRTNMPISVIDRHGKKRQGKVLQVLGFMGLERVEVEEAEAGDIVAISGIADLSISDTLCALDTPEALPALTVDEPTISMTFQVNNSPFAGNKDRSGGKFITSRQLRERLERETLHNVALKVEEGSDPDKFLVSGRGELHLSVLIETMRREGFELAVSRPEVIIKEIDGQQMEPVEQLVVDIEEHAPGRRHGKAGHPQGPAEEHGARRQGTRAPGLHDPGPRPDRFPERVPHPDPGLGPAVPRVRPLRPEGNGRDRQAPERRDDRQRPGRDPGVFARAAGRTRQAVRRRRRPRVRRPAHRHPLEGQRPDGQRHQDQAADQHARFGQG